MCALQPWYCYKAKQEVVRVLPSRAHTRVPAYVPLLWLADGRHLDSASRDCLSGPLASPFATIVETMSSED